jgi:hypothetical protein
MTMRPSEQAVIAGMNDLAGTARRTGRSVRGVAKWSHNQRCGTNNAMFAAKVDDNRLLAGTSLAPEFGQGFAALARGARVEALGRQNHYAITVDLLRQNFGFGIGEVIALDLRHGFQLNNRGMAQRAKRTADAIEASLSQRPDAPNIIDGAVLPARIGGFNAYLEADGIGARTGPVFHINEFKGWPVVDSRAEDAGKLGAAVSQMGIYRYLLGSVIDALGGSIATVSPTGLLITPKNVGLTLIGNRIDLGKPTTVAETTLANLPDPAEYMGIVPAAAGFGLAGDVARPEGERLEHLDRLVDQFGTRFQESCLTNCGLAKFCRVRARAASSPVLAGATTARFLPGVVTLNRAADLADGAPARTPEIATGAADILAMAGALYREKASGRAPVAIAPTSTAQPA